MSRYISEAIKASIREQAKHQCGRATVAALQLNNSYAVVVRQAWIAAGWHPPQES